jgi:hypothetical protein
MKSLDGVIKGEKVDKATRRSNAKNRGSRLSLNCEHAKEVCVDNLTLPSF